MVSNVVIDRPALEGLSGYTSSSVEIVRFDSLLPWLNAIQCETINWIKTIRHSSWRMPYVYRAE
jgi:hypothetical protein